MHPLYKILKDNAVKRGPFATVWRARDEVLGREVALKELRGWSARPARARARFQFAHLRRLALDHPGLAPAHGADCDRGWLVLDYFPEGSLADRLGPLPPERVQPILAGVLATLAYLHERGLVHGAVKPTNLFLTQAGQVLLADGLGLRLDAQGRALAARELFEGEGTEEAKYLAPECTDGRAEGVGPAADLYALGLTALELLLGGVWFAALFPRVQVAAQRWDEWHRSEEVLPPCRRLLPAAPAALAEVLDGLVRKPPAARLSAAAALAVLCPPSPPPAPEPPAGPEALAAPHRRRRAVPALLVACLLAGLGLGAGLARLAPAPRPLPAPRPQGPPDSTRAELTRARAAADKQRTRAGRLGRDLEAARADLARTRGAARQSSTRADRLDADLKSTRADLTGARADLARARAATDEQRARAGRLDRDLKVAQSHLACALAAARELKVRLDTLVPIELLPVPGQPPGRPSPSVAAALRKLGGKVEEGLGKAGWGVLKVDLSGKAVTGDTLALIAGLASLQTLILYDTPLGDAGLTQLKGLRELRTLYLSSTQVTDAGLIHLAALPGLQTLNLTNTRVSDAGLAHLDRLPRLQELHLATTRVSDAGLARLGGLSRLQALHLSYTPVTDAGLAHLAALPQLRTLDLSYTQVSDAGLARLKALPRLEKLYLSGLGLTDTALSQLKGLTRLRELDLTGTRVSGKGAAQLRQALPRCQVRH